MYDKSNVEFEYFKINDVSNVYGLESKNSKSITITKSYDITDDNEIIWDGTYDINYDNVTELNCMLLLDDEENIDVQFITGTSLHGMSDEYELNIQDDQLVINAIIERVKTSSLFKEFLIEMLEKNFLIEEEIEL